MFLLLVPLHVTIFITPLFACDSFHHYLKNEDNLKNEDDLKNEDNLKNKKDLKNEEDLKNWPSRPKLFLPPLPSA